MKINRGVESDDKRAKLRLMIRLMPVNWWFLQRTGF